MEIFKRYNIAKIIYEIVIINYIFLQNIQMDFFFSTSSNNFLFGGLEGKIKKKRAKLWFNFIS